MDLSTRFYETFILEDRYLFFLEGLKMTLILTLGSFLLGTLLGAAICLLLHSKNKVVRKISSLITNLLVQLPTMVMLMIFVYIIFGDSSLPILLIVIFGLMLKAGAYLAEIFNTALSTVEPGEIEAARTLGMTGFQAFRYVMLPQAVTAAKPIYKNQFITSLQETSVVGYLALMDLTRASSVVTSRTLDAFFGLIVISVIYLIIGYIGEALIELIGKKKHLGGVQA